MGLVTFSAWVIGLGLNNIDKVEIVFRPTFFFFFFNNNKIDKVDFFGELWIYVFN